MPMSKMLPSTRMHCPSAKNIVEKRKKVLPFEEKRLFLQSTTGTQVSHLRPPQVRHLRTHAKQ